MPATMAFDHKELPPELLYKLEEAKTDERRMLEPSDATSQYPTLPDPEHSPIKGAVAEVMSHWATDDEEVKNVFTDATYQELKGKFGTQDLDDNLLMKSGMTADFVPDSAGPTADVGMPETKPLGGNLLGDGGGGGAGGDGGGAADDWFPGDGGGGGMAGGGDGSGEGEDEGELEYGGDGDDDDAKAGGGGGGSL
jgi:hypothetical protein